MLSQIRDAALQEIAQQTPGTPTISEFLSQDEEPTTSFEKNGHV